MKIIFSICLFLLTIQPGSAQHTRLQGKVIDAQSGTPLQGATISLKGSGTAVATDAGGNFSFPIDSAGRVILLVSYAGYLTEEVKLNLSTEGVPIITVNLLAVYKAEEGIVVSATRRTEKITDAPTSVQLIGSKELQMFTGSNTLELLSKVQGLEFTRTGVDVISFNARGLNNAFNGKIFQIVDNRNSMTPLSGGLPMHNNFSLVKEDIERIEVVLGPQTALFGPNAHNAIINFITKDPRTSPGTTLSFSVGNRSQLSGRFRQATRIDDKWAYKITGEFAYGRDFKFYDSVYAGNQAGNTPFFGPPVAIPERGMNFNFRHIRGEAHVYYKLRPGTDIIFTTGGSHNNSINTNTIGHNMFVGMANWFVQARYQSPRFFLTAYNTWADFGNSFNVASYTRDYWNRTHSTLSSGPNRRLSPDSAEIFAMRYGVRLKERPQRFNAEIQYNYKFEKSGLYLVSGLSFQKDKPRAFGISLVDSFQRIRVTQLGAVIHLDKSLPAGLRAIAAARWDHHSNFGNFISPKLGLVKHFNKGTLRLTWARAYSMPSIAFQYANANGLFFGNGKGLRYIPNGSKFSDPLSVKMTKPLEPEEISTWELGYKGPLFKKIYADLCVYNGVSRNFFSPSISIGGRALDVGGYPLTHNPAFAGQVINDTLRNAVFTTVFNFGRVKVYGLDLGLNYQFNDLVKLILRYSWMGSDIGKGGMDNDANDDGQILADEKSLNSPRKRATVILDLQNLYRQRLALSLSARYVEQFDFYSGMQISTAAGEGKRGVLKGANGSPVYLKNFDWGPLGGFVTLDLNVTYRFSKRVSSGLNVTNILNSRQREFAGSPSIGRLIILECRFQM